MHDLAVTVVAVATPPGRGGVGCVRLSGPDAHALSDRLFSPARPGPARPGKIRFGRFLARDGTPVDHGFRVLLVAGASFTGEPAAELWAHGSPAVLAELVEAAVEAGASPAGPGEFTYRALRHGRLDLTRAEAVRDLVASRTLFQARVAFAQAEGALARRLAPLRESLLDLLARGEAAVEFADEAETHLPPGRLGTGLREASAALDALLEGFRLGRRVREGATVAITGSPNVGKSSLFNRLLARDRAIVAETPGTTRDTLEETFELEGVPVRLVDTAGLRAADDPVEGEGVVRARRAREEADLVILVLDATREVPATEPDGRTLVALNKIDLPEGRARAGASALRISARTGEGLEALRGELRDRLLGSGPIEDPILTDARHARGLREAGADLARAREALEGGLTEEVVLEDLREALSHLGEITGEYRSEDLYDRIFSTFCIGK